MGRLTMIPFDKLDDPFWMKKRQLQEAARTFKEDDEVVFILGPHKDEWGVINRVLGNGWYEVNIYPGRNIVEVHWTNLQLAVWKTD